ncbi:MAG: Hpt domain-containing protein [Lachnospiraceae bacterium]|nr:Hpt domain-containing protein [Lachnospiraceae bacterium]
MNKETLIAANVDYENGKKRFAGNEALYEKYLLKFKDDVHYEAAKTAFGSGDFDTLLKEAHTLKGVAGTLGLVDIYQTCADIVTALRGERTEQVPELVDLLQSAYEKTMDALK